MAKNNHSIGNAGEFYVLAQLAQRGYIAGKTDDGQTLIDVIATDPDKCPEGTISWKQNRNHVGQALRKEANQRSFNEALAQLAETEGRLISGDPVIWQR